MLPFGEALFVRMLFVLIPIAIIVWWRGAAVTLRIVSVRNLALRALFGTGSTFLVVASLSLLPIGQVLTLVFVTPVLVTALAPLLLKERVGWHRWFAVLCGFAGVVIMLQPDAGSFRYAAVLPLAAALLASLRDIVTRRISSRESSLAILAFSILGLILASLATVPFGWREVSVGEIAIAGGSGLLFGLAHYLLIEGYRTRRGVASCSFPIYQPALGTTDGVSILRRDSRVRTSRGRAADRGKWPLYCLARAIAETA